MSVFIKGKYNARNQTLSLSSGYDPLFAQWRIPRARVAKVKPSLINTTRYVMLTRKEYDMLKPTPAISGTRDILGVKCPSTVPEHLHEKAVSALFNKSPVIVYVRIKKDNHVHSTQYNKWQDNPIYLHLGAQNELRGQILHGGPLIKLPWDYVHDIDFY